MRGFFRLLGRVLGAILMIVLFILVLAPYLYVELQGQTAPGEVVGLREEIEVRRSGWSRTLALDVRYQPADRAEPEQAAIRVAAERYDRALLGEAVQVRYMSWPELRQLGEIAAPRLADQPPFGQLLARFGGEGWLLAGFAIWLLLLALWNWLRRWWLLLPLVLMMVFAALYLVSGWPEPAPPGPQLRAQASVRETHLVDELLRSRRSRGVIEAIQPYTIVELSFVPEGARNPVVAVDLIDAESAAGLDREEPVQISYSAADPRWARIEGASRTYYWKNLGIYIPPILIILALAGGVWLLSWRHAARRRRQAAP